MNTHDVDRQWLGVSIMATIGACLFFGAILYFTGAMDAFMNLSPSSAVYAQVPPEESTFQTDISWIVGLIGGLILIGASIFQGIRWLRGQVIRELKDAIEQVKLETKTELSSIKIMTDSQTKIIEHRLSFVDQQLKDIKETSDETRIRVDRSMEEHTQIHLAIQRHGDAISNIQKYLEANK